MHMRNRKDGSDCVEKTRSTSELLMEPGKVVLSPYLFSAAYLDELITKLRKLDIGCHIAGV